MESQDLVEFLNEYLTAMTDIVMQYDGTLDKYIGDAIMAIYGAPMEQKDHAHRACACALDMIERLRDMRLAWQAHGKPPIDIGIGINSGTMTVGNMGSQKRFDFTVMGDHVNLGSRLEGTNKQYGTNIIISEFTYHEVKDQMFVRELDMVRVKGKKEPVRIYELIGRVGHVKPYMLAWIDLFQQGLSAYRDKQWDEAITHFERVKELKDQDAPADLYIERCEIYRRTPPPSDWDGVYTMTTK
jgi:adenylate cyclase